MSDDLRAALRDLSSAVSVLWNTYASDEMEGLEAEWAAVGKADECARLLLSSAPALPPEAALKEAALHLLHSLDTDQHSHLLDEGTMQAAEALDLLVYQPAPALPVAPEGEDPSEAQLAEWERVAEEATPGPWGVDDQSVPEQFEWLNITSDGEPVIAEACNRGEDARFIAAARTAVPALLRALRAARDAALAEVDRMLRRVVFTEITGLERLTLSGPERDDWIVRTTARKALGLVASDVRALRAAKQEGGR